MGTAFELSSCKVQVHGPERVVVSSLDAKRTATLDIADISHHSPTAPFPYRGVVAYRLEGHVAVCFDTEAPFPLVIVDRDRRMCMSRNGVWLSKPRSPAPAGFGAPLTEEQRELGFIDWRQEFDKARRHELPEGASQAIAYLEEHIADAFERCFALKAVQLNGQCLLRDGAVDVRWCRQPTESRATTGRMGAMDSLAAFAGHPALAYFS